MTLSLYIGLGSLCAGLIANRIMSERALRLLSDSEKLKLLNSFSRLRAWSATPAIPLMILSLAVLSLPSSLILIGYLMGWVLLTGFLVWQYFYVHRRLRELEISESYRIAWTRARWCSYAGMFTLFVCSVIAVIRVWPA